MMLAPSADKLQPLPPEVQPAVSQSVQRAATPADLETIQNVQASEPTSSAAPGQTASPLDYSFAASSSNSIVLWAALIIAVLVAAGAAWLWRSF